MTSLLVNSAQKFPNSLGTVLAINGRKRITLAQLGVLAEDAVGLVGDLLHGRAAGESEEGEE